ncbi:MAG: ABC transporter permease [Clostridium sp.]|nr:ABC transporter permease [Clostridium sp.]
MQILTMIKNQLKLLFNNRVAVFAVIALPLMLTYFLSYANSSNKTNLYVADLDKSTYSKELINLIKDHDDINLVNLSEAQINKQVEDNSISAGFIINKNFGANLSDNKKLNLKMVENYENQEGSVLQEVVIGEANTLKKIASDSKDISSVLNVSNASTSKDLLKKLKTKNNISITDKTPIKNQDSTTKSLVGFLIMFLWFVVIQGFRTLVEEKENNTFNRILGTPINYYKYLLSKIVSTYIFSLIVLTLALVIGKYAFNITFAQNLIGEGVIFAVYTFALTGIVMIFVPFIKKQQTFTILGSVLMALTGMLGGSFFPIDQVGSKAIVTLSKFTPESWAINSISDITFNNSPINSQLNSVIILLTCGILGITISYILLNIKIKSETF